MEQALRGQVRMDFILMAPESVLPSTFGNGLNRQRPEFVTVAKNKWISKGAHVGRCGH